MRGKMILSELKKRILIPLYLFYNIEISVLL